jgi:hypothetical protein
MNKSIITFPQTYNSISTINLKVKVDMLDNNGNISSSIICVLQEDDVLVSSDLDMSMFVSGKYNITILDSGGNPYVALQPLFITGYTLFNALPVNSTDQIIDVITYDNIIATNSDQISTNLNNTNIFVELISKDSATMNQKIVTIDSGHPISVILNANIIVVVNVANNGYTKYKVIVFNRVNNVN